MHFKRLYIFFIIPRQPGTMGTRRRDFQVDYRGRCLSGSASTGASLLC